MIASMVFYVGKKERKNKERWKADERILAAYRITWPCVRGLASALQRPPTAPVITELGPAGEHELCAKIYRASVPLSLVREAAAALCCSRGLRSLLQPPNRDIPRAYMYLLLGCELLSRACALQKEERWSRKEVQVEATKTSNISTYVLPILSISLLSFPVLEQTCECVITTAA